VRWGWRGLAAVLLLSVLAAARVAAQDSATGDASLDAWEKELTQSEQAVQTGRLDESQQRSERNKMVDLLQQAQARSRALAERIAEVQELMTALGPPPAEGAPPEPQEAQDKRTNLQKELTAVQALKARADLIIAKSTLMLRRLEQLRIDTFTEELLQRGPTLLSPSTWRGLPDEIAALRTDVANLATQEDDADGGSRSRRLLYGGAALLVVAAGFPLVRWLRRRLDGWLAKVAGPAPERYRVVAAIIGTVLRFFLPFAVTLVLLFVALAAAVGTSWQALIESVALAFAGGASLAFLLLAVGRSVLRPDLANWRLLDLSDRSATALHRRWVLASLVFGAILATRTLANDLQPGPALTTVVHTGQALLGGFVLLSMLPARLWRADEQRPPAAAAEQEDSAGGDLAAWLGQAHYLRFLALLVAVTVLVTAVLGYQALSDYVGMLFLSAVAIGFVLIVLRGGLRDAVHNLLFAHQRTAEWRRFFLKTDRGAGVFELVVYLLLDLFLLLLALYALLRIAGTPEAELELWFVSVLNGFSVGGVSIQPLGLLLAVLVFVLILLITRILQRQTRGRLFSAISLDSSVQQSISTGIGYVGVIAAILIAVNVMGVDLTNLALIAGALSVGIGFGLQNIVSNFVSGLILLIERPVKVGDWVVVGGNEGVIKRISVRATEIETWQRSSVLVPNSDLVSTAVTNWTHKDRIGRLDIPVRVPFGSDPKQVHDVLLAAASDSRDVLRFPAAYVYFKSFSPDGMDFDIRVYVPDIYNLFISVANEVRFSIVSRFAEAGIEMALPQRVVRLSGLDPLRPASADREPQS